MTLNSNYLWKYYVPLNENDKEEVYWTEWQKHWSVDLLNVSDTFHWRLLHIFSHWYKLHMVSKLPCHRQICLYTFRLRKNKLTLAFSNGFPRMPEDSILCLAASVQELRDAAGSPAEAAVPSPWAGSLVRPALKPQRFKTERCFCTEAKNSFLRHPFPLVDITDFSELILR